MRAERVAIFLEPLVPSMYFATFGVDCAESYPDSGPGRDEIAVIDIVRGNKLFPVAQGMRVRERSHITHGGHVYGRSSCGGVKSVRST